jgi:hypothetical protein
MNPVHTTPPPPLSLRYILISSHIHLGLPSGLLSTGFPTKTLIHCSMKDYKYHQTSIYSWQDRILANHLILNFSVFINQGSSGLWIITPVSDISYNVFIINSEIIDVSTPFVIPSSKFSSWGIEIKGPGPPGWGSLRRDSKIGSEFCGTST